MKEMMIKKMFGTAEERLESARGLIRLRKYRDSVSRSYYGVLDACRTILAAGRVHPKTHKGAITEFNKRYIKRGRLSKRFGHILSKIEQSRLDADYDLRIKFTKKEAQEILAQAEDFITEIKKLLFGKK